eukprot:TRINITY_DN4982_c0_g1_i1.p1 TRINITY_DN4982_c0_g1~~TRINITY_DN4982_c0_g1_i1.p1  ORF type:complete len:320 (+),score=59.24 TRINITY_DN4982_c0_g1_i1:391-1350(+)
MESQMTGSARCWSGNPQAWAYWNSSKQQLENPHRHSCNVHFNNLLMGPQKLAFPCYPSISFSMNHQLINVRYPIRQLIWRHPSWRAFAMSVNLDKEPLSVSQGDHVGNNDDFVPEVPSEKILSQQLDTNELKSLLADSERTKLIRKLSEANQHNRFLKRQLQVKEDALVNFKSELAVLELEFQTLVRLAEEVAKSGIQPGSRKINGKYIQSHILSRLEVVHEKLKEQIKDVDAVKFEEVSMFWYGMAENVQVMGSFDGWSQGEQLSPEYTGAFTKFSTTLKLRPGRYEIKFLVDGEWQLSPELPTTGDGLMENNLLIVE